MSGSVYGNIFRISTWGESHGKGIGVVVDGCPAGLTLNEEIIQDYLDRRKPGQTKYATPRKESDSVEILSGVFEQKTTGAPISMVVMNTNQQSADYSEIAGYYRPGHADYTFDQKYGFRDYRGGGRSSGRETIGRVAAGAVAVSILKQLGVDVCAYTRSIGSVSIEYKNCDRKNILLSPMAMPDLKASLKAEHYLDQKMQEQDSAGGVIECIITGLPAGIGEPVFEKLDANLAKAVLSMGAIKGIEFGSGFLAAEMSGGEHNDNFRYDNDGNVTKLTNHAGGILGGMSDGSEIIFRAAVKPTPSISKTQRTINKTGENIDINVKGRHDPIIVPRAVVVVEAMTALTLVDMLFMSMTSRMDNLVHFFHK
ncbi:chorismate synthase [Anaerocolumna cellulosilytica]|uniref:Chorismate synthase n=1 Tax=Anaerocolumna cellulosilytica TaxID=433286 RepID=A0A6S6R2M4_9FIRM|nr:chorismate synthase [Anaerocolumna cellulosilytica]MBB5196489.1 chorismate synthase [Anaerocolumna cellulosilytica]BCJ95589.1 chorismate synthase [Anaerocolumna cellulosilytica]